MINTMHLQCWHRWFCILWFSWFLFIIHLFFYVLENNYSSVFVTHLRLRFMSNTVQTYYISLTHVHQLALIAAKHGLINVIKITAFLLQQCSLYGKNMPFKSKDDYPLSTWRATVLEQCCAHIIPLRPLALAIKKTKQAASGYRG